MFSSSSTVGTYVVPTWNAMYQQGARCLQSEERREAKIKSRSPPPPPSPVSRSQADVWERRRRGGGGGGGGGGEARGVESEKEPWIKKILFLKCISCSKMLAEDCLLVGKSARKLNISECVLRALCIWALFSPVVCSDASTWWGRNLQKKERENTCAQKKKNLLGSLTSYIPLDRVFFFLSERPSAVRRAAATATWAPATTAAAATPHPPSPPLLAGAAGPRAVPPPAPPPPATAATPTSATSPPPSHGAAQGATPAPPTGTTGG